MKESFIIVKLFKKKDSISSYIYRRFAYSCSSAYVETLDSTLDAIHVLPTW